MKFYTRDWLDSKELRRCSPLARATLVDLMCIAHEGTPYGFLVDKVGPMTKELMAFRCALSLKKFLAAVQELISAGRLSEQLDGSLFISRMVKDEEVRLKRASGGSLSKGNPDLGVNYNSAGYVYLLRRTSDAAVKIGIAVNVKARIWKIKSAMRPDIVDVIETFEVEDMGTREAELHRRYDSKRISGEWFSLSEEDIGSIATSLMGSEKEVEGKFSRAYTRADSDSGSREVKPEEEIKTSTRARSFPRGYEFDELYAEFRDACKSWGMALVDPEDFLGSAWNEWRLLDSEQKLAAIAGIRQRESEGADPAFAKRPDKYLNKREWKRTAAKAAKPKEAWERLAEL